MASHNPTDLEFDSVDPPSEQARTRARQRYDTLLEPPRSLGRLEELGAWLAACQGRCPPHAPTQTCAVVFPAAHGIAARGVSRHPATATTELTGRFNSGGTALHALTGVTGANITTAELDNYDSGAIDVEDALTTAQTDNTVRAGAALADAEVDSGADLLLPATVGVGSSTPASVIVAAMIDTEPVAVVGRGSGIDDRTWMRKAAVVRDALRRSRTAQQHPLALLRIVGGADLAAATGFLAQAAVRRTPVLLDGLTSVAAALLAERLATGARAWWLAPHSSPEPAHSLALRELELTPLLDLGITLQQGAAASTALPLLHMAARTLHDMPPREQADLTQPW